MNDISTVWIGTSWKMNKTLAEAQDFVNTLLQTAATPGIQRFVIPPFTLVREVKKLLADTDILVGAQNMHWENEGAWTGEISAPMLVDCGIDLVEIGHSERREHFGETDRLVGLKTQAAIRHRLIPLICIGENLQQRDAGEADTVLKEQVTMALEPLTPSEKDAPVLFAYEPVWAIGDGGIPASADYANERQSQIIAVAESILGHRAPCLYGGSVNAGNCQSLITCPAIDGLFIGRSAWHAPGYIDIVERSASSLQNNTTL